MRSKNAFYNLVAAVIELIAVTLSSFIVPYQIIHTFGSNVNGLIASITQFLSYITLIESGIGAIGRASLYQPLAQKDDEILSGCVKALELFYRKIAYIFICYVILLALLFPFLVNREFSWIYTSSLVIILAISIFAQYYFGITYQTVIQADQKKYVVSLLQAAITLINMIVIIIMIKLGANVHIVQLCSVIVFAIRPIVYYLYAHRKYNILKNIEPRNEVLKQRWDGLAQHLAFFIHKNTDIVILTVLTNIKTVSVYSVYMLPIAGCSKVVNIFSSSLEPAFGNMIARGEISTLKNRVLTCSIISNQIAVILFSTTWIIITPFIQLYTKGITDINYVNPSFGLIMLIAEAFYCVRMPYQAVVYAAGHFKQTRNGAIVEAAVNIILSVILVFKYGLIGVALGTMISMAIRTMQYIWYYHYRLLRQNDGVYVELKKAMITLLEISIIVAVSRQIAAVPASNYLNWFIYSCGVGLICFGVVSVISVLFYKKEIKVLKRIIMNIIK